MSLVARAEQGAGVWPVPEGERGKLLLEIYSGGTFKKSMNYHSFREAGERRQESKEVSIENLETDSLEISGSQLTVLPPPRPRASGGFTPAFIGTLSS